MIYSLLFFVASAGPAAASVSCHCFQDRTFDPSRPSASDEYFLATTQNSLIAASLHVTKRSIVQAKMGGVDADLLWVAYYVSDRTGLDAADLFELWTSSGVSGFLKKTEKLNLKLDKPFIEVLEPNANVETLARGAFRSVMVNQLGIALSTLDNLEVRGANRKEQVLAVFISLLLAEDPAEVFTSVNSGKRTWSQALASTGLDPKQIESSWVKLIKFHLSDL